MSFKKDPKAAEKKTEFVAFNMDNLMLSQEWEVALSEVIALAFFGGAWVGVNHGKSGVKVNVRYKELASSEWYATPAELLAFVQEFAQAVSEENKLWLAERRKKKLAIWFDSCL